MQKDVHDGQVDLREVQIERANTGLDSDSGPTRGTINHGGQSLVPEISLYQTNSAHMEMSNWLWNFFFIFLNNYRKLLLKEKDLYTEKND